MEFSHLGVTFVMPVVSLLEAYNVSRECLIRTDGVLSGDLGVLFREKAFGVMDSEGCAKKLVGDELLGKTKACREDINTLFAWKGSHI